MDGGGGRDFETHVGMETTFTYAQQEQQRCTEASIQ